jgi:hypothetical protein
MKRITLLVFVLSFSICSFAQITIKGVVASDSIPLESVSVIIKNSKKGTITNVIGEFKIEATKGDTLSISYIGFKTKNIIVNQDEIFRIRLEEGGQLNEVVISAYLYSRRTKCGSTRCYTRCGNYCEIEITKEKLNKIQPKLYPNPSSNGMFQLKLAEHFDEVKISVANLSGQTVQNSKYQKFGEKLSIDLSQCATGIYIINIIAVGKPLEAIKAIRS